MLTESRNFQNIIRSKLKDFFFELPRTNCLYAKNRDALPEFLKDKTVMIVPPNFVQRDGGAEGAAWRDFAARGGRIIPFEYQIERGALVYIEKNISEQMARQSDVAGLL